MLRYWRQVEESVESPEERTGKQEGESSVPLDCFTFAVENEEPSYAIISEEYIPFRWNSRK